MRLSSNRHVSSNLTICAIFRPSTRGFFVCIFQRESFLPIRKKLYTSLSLFAWFFLKIFSIILCRIALSLFYKIWTLGPNCNSCNRYIEICFAIYTRHRALGRVFLISISIQDIFVTCAKKEELKSSSFLFR